MAADPRVPGDFAAVRTGGPVGRLIQLGEALDGKGFTDFEHAVTYVGDGMVLEAEPAGARIRARGIEPGDVWSTGVWEHAPEQVAQVASLAELLKGTPYSALDYLAIAQHHLVPWLNPPIWPEPDHRVPVLRHRLVTLRTFVASSGHQICSQLDDYFQLMLGTHLFTDGRWPGYVVPVDVSDVIEQRAEQTGKKVLYG